MWLLVDEKGNVLYVRVGVFLSEGSSCSEPSCAILRMNKPKCCKCKAAFFRLCVCVRLSTIQFSAVRAGDRLQPSTGLVELHGLAGSVLPLEQQTWHGTFSGLGFLQQLIPEPCRLGGENPGVSSV